MHIRMTFRNLMAMGVCSLAVLPALETRAEWSADGECLRLRAELSQAFDDKNFDQAATTGRALFSRCPLRAC
jgi:hypothetical protein